MIKSFNKINGVIGVLNLPGDKSISHRSVMFASLAKGKSEIYNCLDSEDLQRTINAFEQMGCKIEISDKKIIIEGNGIDGLEKPIDELYMGNSGTTTRLMTGILAAQKFPTKLTGDPSLSSRPMQRVIDPLNLMGAQIKSNNGLLPMEINPDESLRPINYELPIASAQIKSCILLAGLFLDEETCVIEKKESRNHTEKMLGLLIEEENGLRKIYSSKKYFPQPAKYIVPSDISTAAFFIVLTLLSKNSELKLPNISLNESRIGIIKILKNMRANIEYDNVNIIDEIPILSIAGIFAEGNFIVRNAKELRHKESDRIRSVCENLKLVGLSITEFEDGFQISGNLNRAKVTFESYDDHRIAMAFSVLSVLMDQGGSINNFECVSISNPNFEKQLEAIIKF